MRDYTGAGRVTPPPKHTDQKQVSRSAPWGAAHRLCTLTLFSFRPVLFNSSVQVGDPALSFHIPSPLPTPSLFVYFAWSHTSSLLRAGLILAGCVHLPLSHFILPITAAALSLPFLCIAHPVSLPLLFFWSLALMLTLSYKYQIHTTLRFSLYSSCRFIQWAALYSHSGHIQGWQRTSWRVPSSHCRLSKVPRMLSCWTPVLQWNNTSTSLHSHHEHWGFPTRDLIPSVQISTQEAGKVKVAWPPTMISNCTAMYPSESRWDKIPRNSKTIAKMFNRIKEDGNGLWNEFRVDTNC